MTKCEGQGQPAPYGLAPLEDAWTLPQREAEVLAKGVVQDARAQVLATGKSAEAEIDFKYALIGTALGVAISAGFLALKICIIRKHLSENDSSDLRSSRQGGSDTLVQKKRATR
uniref:Uncharacterized protein n=1 Tax=Castor canadensis TaxID=51338 RepID=A0A8B7UC23_CASCN|nr:putative uncharacterized protein C10orf128 homolog [Castor canadensis]